MKPSNDLATNILSISRDAVVICDNNKNIVQINPAFTKVTGLQESDLLGLNLLDMITDEKESRQNLQQELNEQFAKTPDWMGEVKISSGQAEIKLICCIRYSKESNETASQYIAMFWQLKQDEDEKQQHFDELTGLPKYYLFIDRIEQALIAAPRVSKSVALLMIGLDRFILINDGLGYAVGDLVLKAIGDRLAKTIRRSDTVARLEGDKFGLVMQITTVEDSVIVAEKILKAMSESIIVEEQNISVTASIGISIFPTDSSEQSDLLKHAESAMRHTKTLGGNHYQFFSNEMNIKARSRIELEYNLRRALKNDEFVVYYQPKVNLEDNKIVGAEALVRWIDPEKGMISPGEFIPVAEETGLIGGIGAFVLCSACRQNSQWQAKGFSPLRISVNVTASQFREKDLLEKVESVLKETQLPAHYLELEITESMLVGNMEQVIEKLKAFRSMGIHVSIDDFGTGYSSLSYLSRFPITTLKIDRAFIHGMETDTNTAEITSAIIGLSHGLSLEVVAEGAESIEHIDFLREQRCDLVQGFYYSRPIPADEFEKLLENGYLYDNN